MRVDEFPPMPDWSPDFVRELAALSPAERRELDAWLAEGEARAEAAKARAEATKKQKRQQKSLDSHVAKAKQLGVDVTVEPNGTATFHTGTAGAPVDKPQAELDKWIAKHAH
jgi:hypothetical protein